MISAPKSLGFSIKWILHCHALVGVWPASTGDEDQSVLDPGQSPHVILSKREMSSIITSQRLAIAAISRISLAQRVFIWLFLSFLLFSKVLRGQDAKQVLAEADRLAWLGNMEKAALLYAKAEQLSSSAGDKRDSLYSRVGRIHAEMQAGNLPEISKSLAEHLDDPLVQSDPRLQLKLLVAKGDVDLEFSPSSSRQDWEEALRVARTLGDKAWEARASGKLGYITFFQGQMSASEDLLRDSIQSAEALGDIDAQIWYASVIGGGLSELGLYDQAVKYTDEALNLAQQTKDAGIPLLACAAKARALTELGRVQEARQLVDRSLKTAQDLNRHLDETYFHIALAKLAVKENNLPLAVAYLETAGRLCVKGGFQHALAWSMFELARIYVVTGDLQKAEERADRALQAMSQVQDLFHLPQHLGLLAQLKVARGKPAEADSLYEQATDLTEAMLVNVPSTCSRLP